MRGRNESPVGNGCLTPSRVQLGQRILEVGYGAGQLAADLAALAGSAGRVEGVDQVELSKWSARNQQVSSSRSG